uniref:Uncharacterized protein n=1 Tax=Sphaerodactylus townsendi TaxID=933632 RepID=A0ACB8FXH5_9SAUR
MAGIWLVQKKAKEFSTLSYWKAQAFCPVLSLENGTTLKSACKQSEMVQKAASGRTVSYWVPSPTGMIPTGMIPSHMVPRQASQTAVRSKGLDIQTGSSPTASFGPTSQGGEGRSSALQNVPGLLSLSARCPPAASGPSAERRGGGQSTGAGKGGSWPAKARQIPSDREGSRAIPARDPQEDAAWPSSSPGGAKERLPRPGHGAPLPLRPPPSQPRQAQPGARLLPPPRHARARRPRRLTHGVGEGHGAGARLGQGLAHGGGGGSSSELAGPRGEATNPPARPEARAPGGSWKEGAVDACASRVGRT